MKRFSVVRISLFALVSATVIVTLSRVCMLIWLSNLDRWTAVELIAVFLPALILYTIAGLANVIFYR